METVKLTIDGREVAVRRGGTAYEPPPKAKGVENAQGRAARQSLRTDTASHSDEDASAAARPLICCEQQIRCDRVFPHRFHAVCRPHRPGV